MRCTSCQRQATLITTAPSGATRRVAVSCSRPRYQRPQRFPARPSRAGVKDIYAASAHDDSAPQPGCVILAITVPSKAALADTEVFKLGTASPGGSFPLYGVAFVDLVKTIDPTLGTRDVCSKLGSTLCRRSRMHVG